MKLVNATEPYWRTKYGGDTARVDAHRVHTCGCHTNCGIYIGARYSGGRKLTLFDGDKPTCPHPKCREDKK
jgi:hypothetical protein